MRPKNEAGGRQPQSADPSNTAPCSNNVRTSTRPINGWVGDCYISSLQREGNKVHLVIDGKALIVSVRVFLNLKHFQLAAIEQIGVAVHPGIGGDFRDEALYLLEKWERQ